MTNNGEPPITCKWCGKPMPPDEEFAEGVCLICYRLLYNAGITDEEIFNQQTVKAADQALHGR